MLTTKWFAGNDDLADAHFIRRVVFMGEQNITEADEMDGTDHLAQHLVIYENGKPAATGRLIMVHGKLHIGRMAVLTEHRGKGYGALAIKHCVDRAKLDGHKIIYAGAQAYAREFYEKSGFVGFGDEYDDAGIVHIAMKREL